MIGENGREAKEQHRENEVDSESAASRQALSTDTATELRTLNHNRIFQQEVKLVELVEKSVKRLIGREQVSKHVLSASPLVG